MPDANKDSSNVAMPARHYLNKWPLLLEQQIAITEKTLQKPNLDYALGFLKWLELYNRKPKTLYRRLSEARQLLLMLDKDAKTATRADIEDLVLRINKLTYYNRKQQKNVLVAATSRGKLKRTLKMLYKYFSNPKEDSKDIEAPAIVKWIKIEHPKNEKQPSDLLTEKEIEALLRACMSSRDKCIIALLANFGCRIGELLALRYKDVVMTDKDVHYVVLNGKTGMRQFPFTRNSLVYLYLIDYMNTYRPSDPEAPLFTTATGNMLDSFNVYKLLRDLKERTGIQKRIHPHLFRFTAGTLYAGQTNESVLRKLMGWTAGSKEVETYVKMSNEAVDKEMIRMTGIKEEKPKPVQQNKTCRKCGEIYAIDKCFCVKCGTNLDTVDVATQLNDYDEVKARMQRLEDAIDRLYQHIDGKTKQEIDSIKS